MKTMMKRNAWVLLVISLSVFCLGVGLSCKTGKVKKPTYFCPFITEEITVDGMLDEVNWKKAEILNFMVRVTDETPFSKTEGRLLWDDKYLYVGFKAYDKDIWSYLTERDSDTSGEDVLETFFKTDPSMKEPYYNFEINALGTVYDAFNHAKREAGGGWFHRWKMWDCEGLKVAVKIKGTLNNLQDADQYWQMEVAIPFASLPTLKGKSPRAGDIWIFHLARYDFSVYLPEGIELSSCVHLTEGGFHDYRDWINLKFVK